MAAPDFNRWKMPAVSVAIHLCIGSVYSWSIFNPALVKELGVVTSAADDWNTNSVVWVFSVAIVFLGLAAAFAGKWLEDVGPRLVGISAACLWGGGFVVGGVGIYFHQLWMVYLGYGVMGGCGLGLGYVSPVSTLIRWFPDRRGMATGMAIMGFGGGAIIGAPLKEYLIRFFYETPQYLGTVEAVSLVTERGRRFAEVAGQMSEVVVVGQEDVFNMIAPEIEGVYAVGTGGTGVAETFLVLGIVYFLIMIAASLSFRVPAEGWRPDGYTEDESGDANVASKAPGPDVLVSQALKTPQFYLLWVILCFNVAAGIGVIGLAKTIMTDIFGSSLPAVVTPAFAATYVLMISLFNMIGRFLWATGSDYIGRRATYFCFFGLGAILYLSIPLAASQVSVNPVVVWLIMFYAATMLIFTMYGGGFATIPAYLSDFFGTIHVGAIHGRLLTAWSVAGIIGPFVVTYFRDRSINDAINHLTDKVNPVDFATTFGAPISDLEQLVGTKTVTISKLMEIAPPGTVDPTSGVYNTAMYVMVALLLVAFFANYKLRPVDEKHHHIKGDTDKN